MKTQKPPYWHTRRRIAPICRLVSASKTTVTSYTPVSANKPKFWCNFCIHKWCCWFEKLSERLMRNKVSYKRVFVSFSDDPCSNNPCENGGSCYVTDSGRYTCICAANFGGPQCTGRNNRILMLPSKWVIHCVVYLTNPARTSVSSFITPWAPYQADLGTNTETHYFYRICRLRHTKI